MATKSRWKGGLSNSQRRAIKNRKKTIKALEKPIQISSGKARINKSPKVGRTPDDSIIYGKPEYVEVPGMGRLKVRADILGGEGAKLVDLTKEQAKARRLQTKAVNVARAKVLRMGLSVLANTDSLYVGQNKYGWTKVRVMDKHAGVNNQGRWIEFNIRNKAANEIINSKLNRWNTSYEDMFMREFEKNTRYGQQYAARRHVEGLLKTAVNAEDWDLANEITFVLQKGDDVVENYWNDYVDAHSEDDIKQYFKENSPKDWQGYRDV